MRKSTAVFLLAAFAIITPHAALAGIIIPTPAGLNPGDTFRIAFVTDSTVSASSSNIGDYDQFVNADATTEAGGGSVTYNGTPLIFSAIGSTAAVSARTHIGQAGAPVYLSSGNNKVAASDTTASSGLWSGHLLSPIDTDLLNQTISSAVWTGTDPTGLSTPIPLGGFTLLPVSGGLSILTSPGWVDDGNSARTRQLPLYGISQPLTVVPEPSAIVLGFFAAAGLAIVAVRKRRRAA